MRRKFVLILLVVAIVLPVLGGVVLAAPKEKVAICHREGNGSWHLIIVSENAAAAHIGDEIGHDDDQPADIIDGVPSCPLD